MKNIEVKILNPEVIAESEKMMVCAARLTQHGHHIKNMSDFIDLYNKSYQMKTVQNMCNLPHPTIQKFGVINLVVVGASRRFLAQITRHQNEVKFMSASLQYSDYSDDAAFVIPYDIIESHTEDKYIESCKQSMSDYKLFIDNNYSNNDAAGYLAPQGLRNVLIISATPYQLKHMIKQRICNRNTKETQYVMLKIWEELYKINPILFNDCGPFCSHGKCLEGNMCCGKPITGTPPDIIQHLFPLLCKETINEKTN